MARKRMFRLDVLETDAFMDMPLTTQALYFHLNLRADDDGFIGNPNQIVRLIGASMDDLKLLIAKRFVIAFEDGVIVIKHWRMHNTLSAYRYKETNFIEDKALLKIKENKAYSLTSGDEICDERLIEIAHRQTKDNTKTTLEENRREENSIDKVNNKKNSAFVKPTLDEVKNYCLERNNSVDPESFIDFYESKGWLIGKNHMKDWKAAVRTWEKRNKGESNDRVLGTDTSRDEAEYERQVREQLKRIESGEFDNESLWE